MEQRDNANSQDPEWLEEFQQLADETLGHGSSCEQVHPIVEQWLDELLAGEPPSSRDSVLQAMSCLTTEMIYKLTPEDILMVLQEYFEEDEVATWLEGILWVGRAFQIALENGRLDDL
jgi:hypothetical protein